LWQRPQSSSSRSSLPSLCCPNLTRIHGLKKTGVRSEE
jgi:hypothetical protein